MGFGGSFPGGTAVGGVTLTTHIHLVPRSRIVELYFLTLKRLHGVVLNKLSTGATLPLPFIALYTHIKTQHIHTNANIR
jgi:hypothetical protein